MSDLNSIGGFDIEGPFSADAALAVTRAKSGERRSASNARRWHRSMGQEIFLHTLRVKRTVRSLRGPRSRSGRKGHQFLRFVANHAAAGRAVRSRRRRRSRTQVQSRNMGWPKKPKKVPLCTGLTIIFRLLTFRWSECRFPLVLSLFRHRFPCEELRFLKSGNARSLFAASVSGSQPRINHRVFFAERFGIFVTLSRNDFRTLSVSNILLNFDIYSDSIREKLILARLM